MSVEFSNIEIFAGLTGMSQCLNTITSILNLLCFLYSVLYLCACTVCIYVWLTCKGRSDQMESTQQRDCRTFDILNLLHATFSFYTQANVLKNSPWYSFKNPHIFDPNHHIFKKLRAWTSKTQKETRQHSTACCPVCFADICLLRVLFPALGLDHGK